MSTAPSTGSIGPNRMAITGEKSAKTLQQVTATPTVGGGVNAVPYNTRMVYPYEPTADSATIDVYTGISDLERLTKIGERAIYDVNTLSYAPVASGGSGVLFPDAVRAKTEIETALRVRPTTFRGPQQLDASGEEGDVYLNRQLHPGGHNVNKGDIPWYKGDKKDDLFKGYPNPDYFTRYHDSIPTHNVQNLSHAQLADALRAESGDFDHNQYLARVGSLLKSESYTAPAHAGIEHVIPSDGKGVNGDPRLLERITDEYERTFREAQRMRVAFVESDPRYGEYAPGIAYNKERMAELEARETQFSKVSKMWGIGTAYMDPEVFKR